MRNYCVSSQRRAAVAALGALSVWACADSLGQNLAFLKDSPIGALNDADVTLLRAAISTALQGADAGTYRTWENSATGNSGKITVLSKFNTEDGRECRRLRVETHTRKAGDGTSTMSLCRTANDEWKVDPHARPVPAVP
jgi:surface antigen